MSVTAAQIVSRAQYARSMLPTLSLIRLQRFLHPRAHLSTLAPGAQGTSQRVTPGIAPAGLQLADPALLQTSSFVNGAFTTPSTAPDLAVINPYDGSAVAHVHSASDADIKTALASASSGFNVWRATPALERAAALDRLLGLLDAHADDIASIIVAENGKPKAEALGEVGYASSYVAQVRAAAFTAPHGTRCAEIDRGTLSMVLREPIGVVLAVTPWNFPLAMLARKLAPALATGCAMIAKPSEETPLSALALAQLVQRAGVPDGVLGVLVSSESRRVCEEVLAHSDVRMVSFTGSTLVGRDLSEMAAKRLQRTAMELGGLAPFIVCEDADVPAAVEGLFKNKFRNAGQSCICVNRVYAHESVADEFVELLTSKMQKEVVLGNGNTPNTTVGPLINREAVARVRGQVANAVELGARIAYEGTIPPGEDPGAFCPPTLLVDVPDTADAMQLETFGPVIAVQTFADLPDAVHKANATEMGLAAYVYSRSLRNANSVSRALEAGMVGVNSVMLNDSRTCFGGVKQSGSGREGSEFGLEDYTEMKYVLMNHGGE